MNMLGFDCGNCRLPLTPLNPENHEKLKALLVEELQIDENEITMEAELTNDLNINSIELADLVMMCEEKFGIEIAEDDSTKFVTVGDVVAYLETL